MLKNNYRRHAQAEEYMYIVVMTAAKRLKECADFMAVDLLDHIIIGDRCFSFKVNGML